MKMSAMLTRIPQQERRAFLNIYADKRPCSKGVYLADTVFFLKIGVEVLYIKS